MSNLTRVQHQIQTGYKSETTPGIAEVLAAADFVNNSTADLISPKFENNNWTCGNDTGVSRVAQGKRYGEISSLKMPVTSGFESDFLEAAGGVKADGVYTFGGCGNYSTRNDVISTKSLTVQQFDGAETYTISGAKPSSLKITAKNGEIIELEAALQGAYSHSVSAITYYQKPTKDLVLNVALNSSLTIDGTAFEYLDCELDFGVSAKMIENANCATGYSYCEITDISPKLTISLYPGDPSAKNLWAIFEGNSIIPVSWSFGSGTGNSYTISANCQIDTQESSYSDKVQQRKLVLIPVYTDTLDYKLKLEIA